MNSIFTLLNQRILDMKQLIKFNRLAKQVLQQTGGLENKEEYIQQFRNIKNNEKKRIIQEDNLFDVAKNIMDFSDSTIQYIY